MIKLSFIEFNLSVAGYSLLLLIKQYLKVLNKYFRNLKFLIIDCLWQRYHPSHLNLESSLKFINEFKPKKAILTNLHSDLDYSYLKKTLHKNIVPAYDGLTVTL